MKLPSVLFVLLATLLVAALPLRGASLDAQFRSPPSAYGPWVYWIWVNGNTTREGIRADLEDMKRVGIRGAMLFEGSLYLPAGPVRYGSDAWYSHVHYAIETAAELGLEIVVMNCAGWATSGGPWNTVENSMKMIVWSEQTVAGGTLWDGRLPQPPTQLGFYREIATLAIPSRTEPMPRMHGTGVSAGLTALGDRISTTGVTFEHPASITFDYSQPTSRRWLEIDRQRGEHTESVEGLGHDDDVIPALKLEASDDGELFRLVKEFPESRLEFTNRVELEFPPTEARFFRLSVRPRTPWNVAELRLTHFRKVSSLAGKTGLKLQPAPSAPREWDASARGEFSPADIIDLTSQVRADGSLRWEAPAGNWTILRFGYTSSARRNHPSPEEGEGLEVDKFDPAALAIHFEHALGRILREAGPHLAQSLTGVLSDSWEAGPQTWTDALPAEFQRRRGYSLTNYLPALSGQVVDTMEETEAFLADYRRTLGELYGENYYGALQRLSHRHGLKLFAEAYGGVLDEPRALQHVDVPMVEFWNHDLYKGFDFATSVAHLTGNPLVLAEAFTSRPPLSGWREHPRLLKPLGDAAYAAGVTGFVLHSYVHQPRSDLAPGFTHGRYGTQFGRLNSWWSLAPAWIDYLKRCQLLLQHGRAVADVLQLQEERLKTESREIPPLAAEGHRADLLSVSHLDEIDVRDGELRTPAGATYRVLQLPVAWVATRSTLEHLFRLQNAGAVLAGPPPFAPASLIDTGKHRPEWEALVAKIWLGSRRPAETLSDALARLQVAPDFVARANGEPTDVRFVHRTSETGDFYFLTNQNGKALTFTADFRCGDREPELWDPLSGRIVTAPVFASENGRTTLTPTLEEAGSLFVVFRRPLPARWPVAVANFKVRSTPTPSRLASAADAWAPAAGSYRVVYSGGSDRPVTIPTATTVPLDRPWTVAFAATRNVPGPIVLDELGSLSTHPDPAVRHFSGIATYSTAFDLPAGLSAAASRVFLNLGAAHEIAELSLNGRTVATLWQPPLTVDVTDFVQPGPNTLQVRVATRWVNRLIGDEQLPADLSYVARGNSAGALERFPDWWADADAIRQRQRATFSTWKHYSADSPLVPAGLVGPVMLEIRPVVSLR